MHSFHVIGLETLGLSQHTVHAATYDLLSISGL